MKLNNHLDFDPVKQEPDEGQKQEVVEVPNTSEQHQKEEFKDYEIRRPEDPSGDISQSNTLSNYNEKDIPDLEKSGPMRFPSMVNVNPQFTLKKVAVSNNSEEEVVTPKMYQGNSESQGSIKKEVKDVKEEQKNSDSSSNDNYQFRLRLGSDDEEPIIIDMSSLSNSDISLKVRKDTGLNTNLEQNDQQLQENQLQNIAEESEQVKSEIVEPEKQSEVSSEKENLTKALIEPEIQNDDGPTLENKSKLDQVAPDQYKAEVEPPKRESPEREISSDGDNLGESMMIKIDLNSDDDESMSPVPMLTPQFEPTPMPMSKEEDVKPGIPRSQVLQPAVQQEANPPIEPETFINQPKTEEIVQKSDESAVNPDNKIIIEDDGMKFTFNIDFDEEDEDPENIVNGDQSLQEPNPQPPIQVEADGNQEDNSKFMKKKKKRKSSMNSEERRERKERKKKRRKEREMQKRAQEQQSQGNSILASLDQQEDDGNDIKIKFVDEEP